MRRRFLVILSLMFLGQIARAQNIQIALDGAADLSPVYPISKIPANAGQVVVLFTLGDQQKHLVHTEVTPINAPGHFTMNREAQTDVIPFGTGSRFLVRHSFIGDLPVGHWRLTVTIDNKPFGTQDFDVVPSSAPLRISSPLDLAGSLTKGTEWNSDLRSPYEPRPGLKIPLDGLTNPDSQGFLHTTMVRKIISLDPEGVRSDTFRSGKLSSSLWTIVTEKGIAVTKTSDAENTVIMQPPEIIIAWPLSSAFHSSWQWHDDKQKPEFGDRFEMWGPVPVKTPQGEVAGYIILQKMTDDSDPKLLAGTIETHVVPGLGSVYISYVQNVPQYQTAIRLENRLTSMKRGSGLEPGIRRYTASSNK